MDKPDPYEKLHTRADNELEERDRSIFSRVVLLAGIALFLIFVAALVFARPLGRYIRPTHPDKHPTSEVVLPARAWDV